MMADKGDNATNSKPKPVSFGAFVPLVTRVEKYSDRNVEAKRL